MDKQEEEALIAKRQMECKYHPESIVKSFYNTAPQCVHCGMTKSAYEQFAEIQQMQAKSSGAWASAYSVYRNNP